MYNGNIASALNVVAGVWLTFSVWINPSWLIPISDVSFFIFFCKNFPVFSSHKGTIGEEAVRITGNRKRFLRASTHRNLMQFIFVCVSPRHLSERCLRSTCRICSTFFEVSLTLEILLSWDVTWGTITFRVGMKATKTRTKALVYESQIHRNVFEDGKVSWRLHYPLNFRSQINFFS